MKKRNLLVVGAVFLLVFLSIVPINVSCKKIDTNLPAPDVVLGPIIFSKIEADYSANEGWVSRIGIITLRMYFHPADVTNENNYLRIIPPLGPSDDLDFPYSDPEWPWQDFDVQSLIFFGTAKESDGRITVNGRGLFTTALVSWHKYPPTDS